MMTSSSLVQSSRVAPLCAAPFSPAPPLKSKMARFCCCSSRPSKTSAAVRISWPRPLVMFSSPDTCHICSRSSFLRSQLCWLLLPPLKPSAAARNGWARPKGLLSRECKDARSRQRQPFCQLLKSERSNLNFKQLSLASALMARLLFSTPADNVNNLSSYFD
jgi:hypothetical protein